VISDLSRALRQQELEAWRRLVRVISHEINNSLTPIASVAGSLRSLGARAVRPADYEDDVRRGLELIESRAESLGRFMASYARLARLPVPQRREVDVGQLIARVAALAPGVVVEDGPSCAVDADPDQLEQLLINLVANAQDALAEVVTRDGAEVGGGVTIRWGRVGGEVVIRVLDDGLGLANPANLFVPFFSTKPGGSGIGLALSRQIAESHGGQIQLRNREDRRGCEAVVQLPEAV
jgi:nitrogen fixation/metabolism regulation signal transduction histidine kinase